jgi:hypothetical protein
LSEAVEGPSRGPRAWRAALILAGTLAFFFGLRTFGRSYSMTRWPVTPARVVSSEVVPAGEGFEARIEYEYILAGRVRRGHAAQSATDRAAADSIGARYPEGREIAVGFDPGNPALSVLRPHIRWWCLAVTLAGACLMGLGLWPRKVPT